VNVLPYSPFGIGLFLYTDDIRAHPGAVLALLVAAALVA
jgi:hypothetical protein